MTTTQALTVVDRNTGEVLDLATVDEHRLARFVSQATDVKDEIGEQIAAAQVELVRRLDRSATWTRRLGEPEDGLQYEIKAPSPEAGTTEYLPDRLLEELRALVDRGTITEDAAEGALRRTISITAVVPLEADLPALVEKVQRAVDVEIGGVNVRVSAASGSDTPVAGGIGKIEKVPGTGAAIARARITRPTPPRKASVKVILPETRR